MIKALVKYKELVPAGHPLMDDYFETRSTVVEVEKATDINKISSRIVDIKIL